MLENTTPSPMALAMLWTIAGEEARQNSMDAHGKTVAPWVAYSFVREQVWQYEADEQAAADEEPNKEGRSAAPVLLAVLPDLGRGDQFPMSFLRAYYAAPVVPSPKFTRCPHCLSSAIETHGDGFQLCNSCGWDAYDCDACTRGDNGRKLRDCASEVTGNQDCRAVTIREESDPYPEREWPEAPMN